MVSFDRIRKLASPFAGLENRGALSLTLVQLCLLSWAWFESDLYRYSALALLLFGALYFFTAAQFKAWIGWLAFACYAWALYVALRYVHFLEVTPHSLGGEAEGIYIFCAMYPTVGYTLFLNRARAQATVRLAMLVSMAVAVASLVLVYGSPLLNPDTGFHSNRIHASLVMGFILLAALARVAWLVEESRLKRAGQVLELVLTVVLVVLAAYLISIWISKGTWLALLIVLPITLIGYAYRHRGGRALAVFVIVAVVAAGFVGWKLDVFELVAGAAVKGTWQTVSLVAGSNHPAEALRTLLASETLPRTLNERLMLWWNAIEIWSSNPVFGVGAAWEDMWASTYFQATEFKDNMHNGYLETGMRFGILGFAFYAMLFTVLSKRVIDARRAGLISYPVVSLWFSGIGFFALTLLSNSNERLPQGEGYMMVMGAVGFWMQYELQYARERGTSPQGEA